MTALRRGRSGTIVSSRRVRVYPRAMAMPSQRMVAILSESADAQGVLQHTRDTLDRFGVPFIERVVESRAVVRDTVAAFEAAEAAVFVVANTSADPLSAA